jgi:ACS family hexuronate transporter-like MFS transporter
MMKQRGPNSKNIEGDGLRTGTETVGSYRWTVCALLFFATTIDYIDRQVLGILAPVLQRDIGWSEIDYGYIVTAFTGAYALGLLLVGRFIDKVGARIGYSVSNVVWSIAAIGHALVKSAFGFGVAKFSLGLGESGNFATAIKAAAAHQGWSANLFTTVSDMFPRRAVGSVVGLGGVAGSVGGMLIATAAGFLLQFTGSYVPLFIFAGSVYLVAFFAIHPLAPNIDRNELE